MPELHLIPDLIPPVPLHIQTDQRHLREEPGCPAQSCGGRDDMGTKEGNPGNLGTPVVALLGEAHEEVRVERPQNQPREIEERKAQER